MVVEIEPVAISDHVGVLDIVSGRSWGRQLNGEAVWKAIFSKLASSAKVGHSLTEEVM